MTPNAQKEKDARPLSRLAEIARGKRELRPATWPGLGIACRMRVLSCSEVQECQAAAFVRFQDIKLPIDVYSISLFEDEVITQLLHRACRDQDNPQEQTFAIDAQDLRENTNVDQRAAMFEIYKEFADSVDPSPLDMAPEEVRTILEAIKKKDRITLSSFGLRALVTYLLTTASQPES